MLYDFIEWLSAQVAERGLGAVVLNVAAVLGAAGAASVPFGSVPLHAASLSIALLSALSLMVPLLAVQAALRRELATASRLLREYLAVVQERSSVRLEISRWSQTTVVNPRGDAVATRRITLKPARADLHFLTCNLRYYGSAPLTPRVRRLVRATAREVSADGVEGARFVSVQFWRDDNEHQVFVHFGTPVAVGREVSVEVQWCWPLYSADLMQGGVEDFDIRFDHPTDIATQEVVLLKRGDTDRFLASSIGQSAHFESHGSDLAHRVTLTIERPTSHERIGVRIDKAR